MSYAMFTGIIHHVGVVTHYAKKNEGASIRIKTSWQEYPRMGDSICCNGICMSVTHAARDFFCIEASPTTLERTTCAQWHEGQTIHLERALKLGDPLDGHLLFGHVDDVAPIISLAPQGDGAILTLQLPPSLACFVAERGSLAVDGVSLTVAHLETHKNHSLVSCALIPLTCQLTQLARLTKKDKVNIEIDMLARYVKRMMMDR